MNRLIITLILLQTGAAFAQDVKGKVADDTNSAIVGATVSWVGHPRTAVMTDENGMFSLAKIASEDRLAFSFIGFKPDTLYITKDQFYSVVLKENSMDLDEVVVRA